MQRRADRRTNQLRWASLLQPNRSPGAHCRSRWRPAWGAPQQGCPCPTQLLVRHHWRAPAWPGPFQIQRVLERLEPQQQHIANGLQVRIDVHRVLHKHIVAVQHRLPIEPDPAEGCQAVKHQPGFRVQATVLFRLFRFVKLRPEPPGVGIEIPGHAVQRPFTCLLQGVSNG